MRRRLCVVAALTACIGATSLPGDPAETALFAAALSVVFGCILHVLSVAERDDNPAGLFVFFLGIVAVLASLVYMAIYDLGSGTTF